MGLSRYGRQLFVRPSYLQLKDRILQLRQASGTYDDKMMIISGTPGIGKSFCALYMASYWIAQGNRVIYEFHDQVEATSIIWYHFPPNSGEGIRILLERDVDHYVTGAADGDTVYIVDGSDILYTLALPRATVFEFQVVQDLAGKFVADSMDVYAQPKYNNFPTFDSLNCGSLWFQVTVAKKHSDFMGGFKALQAAALPTCNLNNFVHPTLRDNSKPIHMIVTTPDRFETCYLKQKQSKGSLFQRGVMKLDLSSAFGQLQHKLGNSASG
ncbi:MAG: hypothetical protein FRX49_00589 [Trebouxia sp. A1-2]|nr:MAG: hypothetical protein FRX49_00589 [Trebouxia sp. A1-2]